MKVPLTETWHTYWSCCKTQQISTAEYSGKNNRSTLKTQNVASHAATHTWYVDVKPVSQRDASLTLKTKSFLLQFSSLHAEQTAAVWSVWMHFTALSVTRLNPHLNPDRWVFTVRMRFRSLKNEKAGSCAVLSQLKDAAWAWRSFSFVANKEVVSTWRWTE